MVSHLQLAYCGNMEIGCSSQDPSRKSVLIGVLQMLGVTEDVVILDSDQAIKVNDINLPGDPDAVGNHHQSDDDGGISGTNKVTTKFYVSFLKTSNILVPSHTLRCICFFSLFSEAMYQTRESVQR